MASEVDVLYQTRIQKERFGDRIGDYELARGKYIVDKAVVDCMRKDAVVLHPLPRLDEITVEVDADPRAAYFRQVRSHERPIRCCAGAAWGRWSCGLLAVLAPRLRWCLTRRAGCL